MNRQKTIIIVVSILGILVLLAIASWLFSQTQEEQKGGPSSTTNDPSFFPFGSPEVRTDIDGEVDFPNESTSTTTEPGFLLDTDRALQLQTMADQHIAGFTFVRKGTSTPHIRFAEKDTGHLFELDLDTNQTVRISNTTIPRIQEALWGNNGERIVLRYLDEDSETIRNFLTTIATSTEEGGSLGGYFLPDNILTIATNPRGPEVFYLSPNDRNSVGILHNDRSERVVFSSPLQEWNALWAGETTIALTTKPSVEAFGFMESLSVTTGETEQRLLNTLGLTTLLSPAGSKTLYSVTTQDGLRLRVLDHKTEDVQNVDTQTLPEKCAWSSDELFVYCGISNELLPSNLPDAWYQGKVSFSDSIWRINTETGLSDFLVSPQVFRADNTIDVMNPQVSPDGNYFAFINKIDSSLWYVRLTESEE